MANSLSTNPIFLDTFSADIDVCTGVGFATDSPIAVEWIRWNSPAAVSAECTIKDGSGGVVVFYDKADVAMQSEIAYFNGEMIKNIYIETSGVTSGSVSILLSKNKAG